MGHPHWNIFEWDHADRKNGNVQHLRDHGIEPHEAEECFSHKFFYTKEYRRVDDCWMEERIAVDGYGWSFRTEVTALCACLAAGI